jgi:hypothetical protein
MAKSFHDVSATIDADEPFREALSRELVAKEQEAEEAARPQVGRKKINFEQTPARFRAGPLRMIDNLLGKGESRADFIREAVAKEIVARRQASAP